MFQFATLSTWYIHWFLGPISSGRELVVEVAGSLTEVADLKKNVEPWKKHGSSGHELPSGKHSHGIDGPFIDGLPIKNGHVSWLC